MCPTKVNSLSPPQAKGSKVDGRGGSIKQATRVPFSPQMYLAICGYFDDSLSAVQCLHLLL